MSLAVQRVVTAPERNLDTAVALKGVTVRYPGTDGNMLTVMEIDLEIASGRFVAIVGPSGCGKSTLLHAIAGLVKPERGCVYHAGRPLQGLAKGTGYVLQNDGLLNWKTVAENMALPLRLQRRPPEEVQQRVSEWLQRTGLARFANAYPSQLSGGMRKRVAIAQALIHRPSLLLMDEPLSALDVQTRALIGNELLALWERTGCTVVMVTHDLEEAIGMADEVVVLTARPARVKAAYPVDLPRPRDLAEIRLTPAFQNLYASIWSDLREEVLAAHAQQS